MLLHNSESNTLVHYNDNNMLNEISIQRTNPFIGGQYFSKIKSFLRGPLHTRFEKKLFKSQEDGLSSNFRRDLKAEAGVNQRYIMFLNASAFLTLEDLRELTSYADDVKKLEKILE